MRLVCESCISSSPTQSFSPSCCGSGIADAGTIHGPSGHAPSKHFWLIQSHLNGEWSPTPSRFTWSRAERSSAMV